MAEVKKIKLADRSHPLFDDNEDLWELYLSAVKGGDDFINSDNLFSHRLEDPTDYNERLDRAYYLNFCKTVCTLYNTYIFKENIERPPDELLDEEFRKDVDGKGNSISKFVDRVGFLSSVFGAMHVLIDVPPTPKKRISKAEAKAGKIRPYCELIYPHQLKDWSFDPSGNLRWIIVETTYYKDEDPTIEREEEKHYKLITTEGWEIQDEDGNPVKFEDGSPNKGDNKLGIIPLITIYNQDVDDDMVGESMLKDIVYINRIIMNWCSCTDEQVERNTFSQLIVPDDGTLAEASETGDDPLYKVGSTSIFTFPDTAGHPPAFISPDVANIQTIWKLVVDHIKEIYRLAGLIGSFEDMQASRSGRAAQMGFISVNSSLADKAKRFQKLENEISKLAYLQFGSNIEDFEEVKYSETFDITSLTEEVEGSFLIMEKNFSVTLNKQMQKDIARKAVPLAPSDIRDQIEDEIEAGDGYVEPSERLNVEKPFDDGSGNPNLQDKIFKTKEEQETEEREKKKKE